MIKKDLIKYIVGMAAASMLVSGIALAEDSGLRPAVKIKNKSELRASTNPGAGVRDLEKTIKNNLKSGDKLNASTTEAREIKKENRERIEHNKKIIQKARVAWVKINATIIRLEKLVNKLDSRISKVKAAGGNTTSAETSSTDAKISIGKARTDIDSIKSILLGVSSTTEPADISTSTIKSLAQDAELQIKTTQSDIEKALQSLKALKTNEKATTTESVEATN